MKNDISAIGNALVDTVFKVEHSLISELGLEIDQMTLSSAEEHAPIIDRLIASGAETVSDCGGSATNSLVAASSFGAKIPFLRPKYLAEDTTSSVDSTLYFLNKLNESADSFNLLQPTSPMRKKRDFLKE